MKKELKRIIILLCLLFVNYDVVLADNINVNCVNDGIVIHEYENEDVDQKQYNFNIGGTYTEPINGYCSYSCNETGKIIYDTNQRVLAGMGFDYPFAVETNKSCTISISSPPSCCTQTHCSECPPPSSSDDDDDDDDGYDGDYRLIDQTPTDEKVPAPTGGPDDNFDDCIEECDGGKYTNECSQKCYQRLSSNKFSVDVMSFAEVIAVNNAYAWYGGFDGYGGYIGSSCPCGSYTVTDCSCPSYVEGMRQYNTCKAMPATKNETYYSKDYSLNLSVDGVFPSEDKIYNNMEIDGNYYVMPKNNYISYINGDLKDKKEDNLAYYETNNRYYYTDFSTPTTFFPKTGGENGYNLIVTGKVGQNAQVKSDLKLICYYEVINKLFHGEDVVQFRQIETTNMFASRAPRWNWSNQEAKKVTDNIHNLGDSVYTDNYLEYHVELTPEGIAEIRNYNSINKENNSYIFKCLSKGEKEKCYSEFIKDNSNIFKEQPNE